MKKKILGLLLTSICVGTIMTGCGETAYGGSKGDVYSKGDNGSYYDEYEYSYDDYDYDDYYATAEEEWSDDYSYSTGAGYTNGGSLAPSEVTDSGALAQDTATNRKMITNVNMNVETEAFTDLTITIENKVKALGGYMESYDKGSKKSYSGSGVKLQYANMTIRVPADRLDELLNEVRGSANVTSMSSSTDDVTLTYVDIQSHKESLKVEYDCLLELLAEAESVDQIILLQSRLAEVRYQIESMESQLRTYDNKVNYSTVYLYVSEVERITPVITTEETTQDKMKSGFDESVYNIKEWGKNFAIGFVAFLPYLAIIVAVVVITLIATLIPLKISKKKREKKVQEWQKQQKMQQEALAQQQEQTQQVPTNQDSQH